MSCNYATSHPVPNIEHCTSNIKQCIHALNQTLHWTLKNVMPHQYKTSHLVPNIEHCISLNIQHIEKFMHWIKHRIDYLKYFLPIPRHINIQHLNWCHGAEHCFRLNIKDYIISMTMHRSAHYPTWCRTSNTTFNWTLKTLENSCIEYLIFF